MQSGKHLYITEHIHGRNAYGFVDTDRMGGPNERWTLFTN